MTIAAKFVKPYTPAVLKTSHRLQSTLNTLVRPCHHSAGAGLALHYQKACEDGKIVTVGTRNDIGAADLALQAVIDMPPETNQNIRIVCILGSERATLPRKIGGALDTRVERNNTVDCASKYWIVKRCRHLIGIT
jgi:hypothetical protein